MNYDIMKPAFAQDMAFAEPEEEENGGPYDNDDDDNYPDFNFVVAGDFGCGGKPERTVSNMLTKDPELVFNDWGFILLKNMPTVGLMWFLR